MITFTQEGAALGIYVGKLFNIREEDEGWTELFH